MGITSKSETTLELHWYEGLNIMSYTNIDYADNVSFSGSEHSAYALPAPTSNKANPSLPGRAPKRPDTDLNPGELERRNKRRARNREAAERQRQRRQHKVVQLEEEVTVLKTEKNELKEQNKKLQEEIERVRFQLKVLEGSQQRQIQQYQYHQQPMTTMASSLTPTFFMADATNPVTPVFVSTPVFAAATQALNSSPVSACAMCQSRAQRFVWIERARDANDESVN